MPKLVCRGSLKGSIVVKKGMPDSQKYTRVRNLINNKTCFSGLKSVKSDITIASNTKNRFRSLILDQTNQYRYESKMLLYPSRVT